MMLELLKQDLQKEGLFNGEIPEIIIALTNAIPNQNIPYRMKLTIAMSEAILFISQFRKNILHWNNSQIPINAISFSIAASGSGKDSSVNAARKCFETGYEIINQKRKDKAVEQAIKKANLAGKENPDEWSVYKNFLIPPNPLFVAPSTTEGFIQHLNDLEEAGIGAGYMYSGEVGAELANSPVLIDNIKFLAEVYDEGSKEVKVLKARENQSREIKNLPVSAMFVGSQDNILYDEATKKIFKREFSTKLARRSFFNFNPQTVKAKDYTSVDEMLADEMMLEDAAIEARLAIAEHIEGLTNYLIQSIGEPITISDEARMLFTKYKRYNEEIAHTIKPQYPISKLVRMHLQWKAFKTAGAICLLEGETEISKDHYIQAVTYCEMLDEDMVLFEQELVKEPYEVFVDYIQSIADDNGKASITLHSLRKLGYISKSGTPQVKMKELVHLATSYDTEGIYTVCEQGICYEAIIKTDVIGVSCMPIDTSRLQQLRLENASKEVIEDEKSRLASLTATGYEYVETDFAGLGEMLEEDLAFTPYRLKDNTRGRDNIYGGIKWVYIDVDNSTITDEQAHFMLSEVNHHIVRTSNANNPFKFRILIELDAVVDLTNAQWKPFIESVTDYLAITADMLPQSQIAFSYSGREILSVTDAEPLAIRDHVMYATDISNKQEEVKPKGAAAKAKLDDPLTTFEYAFEAPYGSGSRNMIRAARHARDLGATKEEIIALMHRINNYWDDPMDEERFEYTVLEQINRW